MHADRFDSGRPSLFKCVYLSDVHGELVLRLTVFVAQRTDEGGAVVFGVLGNKQTGFRTSGLASSSESVPLNLD